MRALHPHNTGYHTKKRGLNCLTETSVATATRRLCLYAHAQRFIMEASHQMVLKEEDRLYGALRQHRKNICFETNVILTHNFARIILSR